MTTRFTSLASAALMLLSACSLSDLDRVSFPRCRTDLDCAPMNATVENPECEVYACVPATGFCDELRSVDVDGDGDLAPSCGGMDCSPTNPLVSSGAIELCNGIDDDCNGVFDGPDEDDDGDEHFDLCAGLSIADDCDDSDDQAYVGAPELCDGIDNDCTDEVGAIRQGGGQRLEPSEDRDGDRHAAIAPQICAAGPVGDPRFFPLDDCDDRRADVHPGAPERCDGIDNDCDGVPDDADGSTAPGTVCLPVALAGGGGTTCVRTREDDLVCWGDNRAGYLGDPGALADAAIVLDPARDLRHLDFGEAGGCGLREPEGSVVCWGNGTLFGRVFISGGDVPARAPGSIEGLSGARQVSVGARHACAVLSDGTVKCWGSSHPFPLVDGVTTDPDFSVVPRTVVGLTDVAEVSAGSTMSCARRTGGEVWCWGFNFQGLLGTGLDGVERARPVPGIDDAVRVAVGDSFACAVRRSGELWCWGDNVGCTTAGCAEVVPTARRLPTEGTIADLVLGGSHGCVRYEDGRFACWGDNDVGQLAIADRDVPGLTTPRVGAVSGVQEVTVGSAHTCALRPDGVRCWGAQSRAELGDGRTSRADPPFAGDLGVRASVIAHAMQIEGNGQASCLRLPDLTVHCAGAADFDELPSTPGSVPGRSFGANVVDVSLGQFRSLVVYGDGRIQTFGNATSAAGLPTDADGFAMGLTDVVEGECGTDHTCLVHRAGTVSCFGLASQGRLGQGSAPIEECRFGIACSRRPVAVVGLRDAFSIEAGDRHNCVIRGDRERGRVGVACWGANDLGQTGSLPLGTTPVPADVEGLPDADPVTDLALGERFSCALVESGQVWCWGQELVAGTSTFSLDPLPLAGAANVVQIAATSQSLCVRQRSGVVRCVGANASGQLGNGTTMARDTLGTVTGLTDARDLGCGQRHCCATRRSGQTVCWGSNDDGQLANGTLTQSNVPRPVASLLWDTAR